MRNIGVILLVLIGILVIACGSSSSSEPTESGLQKRAEAFLTAASNQQWTEMHRFYSPEFQEKCRIGAFAMNFFNASFDALLKDLGSPSVGKFEFHITAVTVDGLNGSATGEMLYKGEPFISFGEQWEFIDGQWYLDDDECPS